VLAGTCLALCSICYRGASLALLESTSQAMSFSQTLLVAAWTLAIAVTVQTAVMGIYLRVSEPGQLTAVTHRWRPALMVGMVAMAASACWFTAMAMHNAAMVRAVGQIELLFTLITSVWLLNERISRREVFGMALLVAGILMLI
jgi:drug/metabolite transporter (DMT)-like permease